MTTKETLEALIPAIMEIEGGYYENVCKFISNANKELERLGSPYRFESTSKMVDAMSLGKVENVDTITVIEVVKCGPPKIKPIEPSELEPFRATWTAGLEPHQELLSRIKLRLPELEDLLDLASSCPPEDSIYRFYHQSYKVFGIQGFTRLILEALRVIAPEGTSFCYLFEGILKDGFDKQFKNHHNRNWAKHTRPLLEAYFHAKYFLEMAVKYGKELDKVPDILPSGWAALLELYEIRNIPIWTDSSRALAAAGEKALQNR